MNLQDENKFILENPRGAEMLPFFLNSLSLSTQRLLRQKFINTPQYESTFYPDDYIAYYVRNHTTALYL